MKANIITQPVNIIGHQIEGRTCRFVYHTTTETLNIVSADNHTGMKDFLSQFGGQRIPNDKDIYQWTREMETQLSIAMH